MKQINKNNWHEFIRSGYRLFFGSGAACPQKLIGEFLKVAESYNNLEITHILTLGETPWADARYAEHLKVNAFFLGRGTREAVQRGDADCGCSRSAEEFTTTFL